MSQLQPISSLALVRALRTPPRGFWARFRAGAGHLWRRLNPVAVAVEFTGPSLRPTRAGL